MQHEFVTRIDVDVPVADAWAVLTDFAAYPDWNPMMRQVGGVAKRGAKLKLKVALEPGSDKTLGLPATVRLVDAPHQLAWGGGVPGLPVLADVHHWFRLEPLSDTTCRFHHGERFRGLLLAPLLGTIKKRGASGYDAFNAAFKERCEAAAK